eukprot:1691948-Prymnesium_polylepis.1
MPREREEQQVNKAARASSMSKMRAARRRHKAARTSSMSKMRAARRREVDHDLTISEKDARHWQGVSGQ